MDNSYPIMFFLRRQIKKLSLKILSTNHLNTLNYNQGNQVTRLSFPNTKLSHFLVSKSCQSYFSLVLSSDKMGRINYLVMKTDQEAAILFNSDLDELKMAAMRLMKHASQLAGHGFGNSFLKWVASFAAIYLLILDRTNWRTNMLTSLLLPYIFLGLPSGMFHFLRGDVGKWISFIAVVLRLFFPRHFPDWLEFPDSLVLLLVVAPSFFAHTLRDSWAGVFLCLIVGCYLMQEHIRASGGFRNSFTQTHGISNTMGIIMLLVFPIWALVVHFV